MKGQWSNWLTLLQILVSDQMLIKILPTNSWWDVLREIEMRKALFCVGKVLCEYGNEPSSFLNIFNNVYLLFMEKFQIYAKLNFENIKGIYLQDSGAQFSLLLESGNHLRILAAIWVSYSTLNIVK